MVLIATSEERFRAFVTASSEVVYCHESELE
jgi:hypothetical protein